MLNANQNAPRWGGEVQFSEAHDADLHASNLTNWQQEYDQTSRGSFYGSIVVTITVLR